MKYLYLLIFFFMIFTGQTYAQTVTWQKWYDFNNYEDNGEDVIQTFDGGYMILANSYSPGHKTILFKIDPFGEVEWRNIYSLGGTSFNSYSVIQASDSNYIISGENGIIFKINNIGDTIWVKNFNCSRFFDHKMTHDGGIIACGTGNYGYALKTDPSGNIVWERSFNQFTYILKIIESKDGSFYMIGFRWNPLSNKEQNYKSNILKNKILSPDRDVSEATIIKTNSSGDLIFEEHLFLPNQIDIIEHPSGDIFIGGGLDSLILYKIDTTGSIIFLNSYYRGIHGCGSMCISQDENILMAGPVSGASIMAVSKIKPDGNLIFDKIIYTIENPQYAFLPLRVSSTNDSGFIFTGFTNYPTNFHESNIYASKTDSACNTPLMVGITFNNTLIPDKFILHQNYPNPFNPTTDLGFGIQELGIVSLKIYDGLGKEVQTLVNEKLSPGNYNYQFSTINSNLPSGVYFYQLRSGKYVETKRMILLK